MYTTGKTSKKAGFDSHVFGENQMTEQSLRREMRGKCCVLALIILFVLISGWMALSKQQREGVTGYDHSAGAWNNGQ